MEGPDKETLMLLSLHRFKDRPTWFTRFLLRPDMCWLRSTDSMEHTSSKCLRLCFWWLFAAMIMVVEATRGFVDVVRQENCWLSWPRSLMLCLGVAPGLKDLSSPAELNPNKICLEVSYRVAIYVHLLSFLPVIYDNSPQGICALPPDFRDHVNSLRNVASLFWRSEVIRVADLHISSCRIDLLWIYQVWGFPGIERYPGILIK